MLKEVCTGKSFDSQSDRLRWWWRVRLNSPATSPTSAPPVDIKYQQCVHARIADRNRRIERELGMEYVFPAMSIPGNSAPHTT